MLPEFASQDAKARRLSAKNFKHYYPEEEVEEYLNRLRCERLQDRLKQERENKRIMGIIRDHRGSADKRLAAEHQSYQQNLARRTRDRRTWLTSPGEHRQEKASLRNRILSTKQRLQIHQRATTYQHLLRTLAPATRQKRTRQVRGFNPALASLDETPAERTAALVMSFSCAPPLRTTPASPTPDSRSSLLTKVWGSILGLVPRSLLTGLKDWSCLPQSDSKTDSSLSVRT